MSLLEKYPESESSFATRPGEGWLEMLKRWLVQCPACAEVRLVVGAIENDQHVCKTCGHTFVINRQVVRAIE